MTPDEALAALAEGRRITAPAAVVVAHQDDETLFFGVGMTRFDDLLLVHLTDGAPVDGRDAHARGFPDTDAYAQARERELQAALRTLGIEPRRLRYGVSDQQVMFHLPAIAERLAQDLADREIVVAQAYEGGHCDHDSAAFVTQWACELIAREGGEPPLRLEFAGYHLRDGHPEGACFLDGDQGVAVPADETDTQRKRAALACFKSQGVANLPFRAERARIAPRYDFRSPPFEGCLYDRWGFEVNSGDWFRAVGEALSVLERGG